MSAVPPSALGLLKRDLEARNLLTLVQRIALDYNVYLDDILNGTRTRRVVSARGAVCTALRAMGFSTNEAAEALAIDHTTVLYLTKPEMRLRKAQRDAAKYAAQKAVP